MKRHYCMLADAQVDILNQVHEEGIFVELRKRLHRLILLNADHPMASIYYRSMTARVMEDVRHVSNYKWIVHPFSMLSLYWEFLVCLVYSSQFILLAVVASTNVDFRKSSPPMISKLIMDYLLTVDIVKQFLTGFYDTQSGKTVLRSRKIAKRYLKKYFAVDFISCAHSYMVILLLIVNNEEFDRDTYPYSVALTLLTSFRIIRIKRWVDALELFTMYVNLSSAMNRAFKAIVMYPVLLVCLYILIFQTERLVELLFVPLESWDWNMDETPTFKLFYSATLMLLHVSYGDKNLAHPSKIIVSLCFMVVGYFLQMSLYTQVMQVWVKFSTAGSKNDNLLQQFTEYINYKDLPISLRKRFVSFYQFKFQNQFYNETQINHMNSKLLRQEILVYVTKTHVQRVEFFKDLPEHVLQKIVSRLKSEIYLANDLIIKAGLPGTCMFFIYFGTVAIYTPTGREICHLEDGAHFGEIALIFNEPRVATVVAVTPCELFMLDRSDFLKVLEPFPDHKDKITKLAQERMKSTVIQ